MGRLRKIAANFPAVRSCQVKKVRAERREEGRTRDDKEREREGGERERESERRQLHPAPL